MRHIMRYYESAAPALWRRVDDEEMSRLMMRETGDVMSPSMTEAIRDRFEGLAQIPGVRNVSTNEYEDRRYSGAPLRIDSLTDYHRVRHDLSALRQHSVYGHRHSVTQALQVVQRSSKTHPRKPAGLVVFH